MSAIRKVAGGGRYVTPTLGEKLALELEDNRGKPLHETLSDREYQVMWMIASGKTVRQIADELFLSPQYGQHPSHAHPPQDEHEVQRGADALRHRPPPGGLEKKGHNLHSRRPACQIAVSFHCRNVEHHHGSVDRLQTARGFGVT